jgi:hypothetical protein
MSGAARLPLYEEILLLALDDDKGTTGLGSTFATAMGAAVLAELAMRDAVTVGPDRQRRVGAVRGAAVDDPLLAECLQQVLDEQRPRPAGHWVTRFAGTKDLKDRAARQLVAKGVLKEDADKVLGIFPRTLYPERDPGPEKELRDRLYWAIFTPTNEVEARTTVVVSLLKATGMLEQVFDKKKLKGRKARVEKLVSGQAVGEATREATDAAMAAVMVATMVPVFIASS